MGEVNRCKQNEHSSNIETHWKSQEKVLNEIYTNGVEQYINKLKDISAAFELNDRILRCIDERTPKGLHSAGSLILAGEKKAIEFLKKSGAIGITSHAKCGAAALDAVNKGIDPDKADEHGKQWAMRLAKISGIPYIEHIEKEQLNGPVDFHIARVAYYDGSGKFNPNAVEGLPIGFVITRKHMDPEHAVSEVKISASIATGHHGFGTKIGQETPFIIIAIADPNNPELSLKKLKSELASIEKEHNGKVIIDGFTAPI